MRLGRVMVEALARHSWRRIVLETAAMVQSPKHRHSRSGFALTVGVLTLNQGIEVRILDPEPYMPTMSLR